MAASFSGSGEQPLDPILRFRPQIRLKMQLGNPPQAQTPGKLVTQIVLRMLERREGVPLDALVASNSNQHMAAAAIRRYIDEIHLNGKQARVRHLEADELDQLFSHCFRNSPGSPLVHKT